MDIKNLLETYNLTQQELSDFTGIPRPRIAKWIENNQSPPKAHDLNIIHTAANFFAKLPTEKAKQATQTHRIILGNVEPIKGYNAAIAAGTVQENTEKYQSENKLNNGIDFDSFEVHNSPNQNTPSMIDKILNIIAHANSNMEKIAEANLTLARTIERLAPDHSNELTKKAQAG